MSEFNETNYHTYTYGYYYTNSSYGLYLTCNTAQTFPDSKLFFRCYTLLASLSLFKTIITILLVIGIVFFNFLILLFRMIGSLKIKLFENVNLKSIRKRKWKVCFVRCPHRYLIHTIVHNFTFIVQHTRIRLPYCCTPLFTSVHS